MKAKVNVYQPKEGHAEYPRVLLNMRQYYIGHITTVMRMFGIGHITMKPNQIGLRIFPEISFRPMDVSPDDPVVLTVRPDIVRRVAEDMMLLGLLELELSIEDEEKAELINGWNTLSTQIPTDDMSPSMSPSKIALNVEDDPTAAVVDSGVSNPISATDEPEYPPDKLSEDPTTATAPDTATDEPEYPPDKLSYDPTTATATDKAE